MIKTKLATLARRSDSDLVGLLARARKRCDRYAFLARQFWSALDLASTVEIELLRRGVIHQIEEPKR
jgi:hypothetical protein